MSTQRDRLFFIGILVCFLVMVSFPYILAAQSAYPDHVFGGFLFNPLDGNSYLAKMYIGLRGEWLFRLPYTADRGAGVFLYTFYILLGHLARWSGLSLIFTFHAARILCSLVLLFVLFRFLKGYLKDSHTVRLAMLFASFGSGWGWLGLPFGLFTSDFWVAEAYPFLSSYTNPHFPLSLALLLYLLIPETRPGNDRSRWLATGALVFLASAALASMSPFSVVIALIVWSGALLWMRIDRIRSALASLQDWMIIRLVGIGLGGLPVLLYQVISIRSDALLAGWNAQNQTPAPPFWDVLLALAPLVLLAPFGMRVVRGDGTQHRPLIIWIFSGMLLLTIPFSLQRRFMVGIYVPIAALASLALVVRAHRPRQLWLWGLMVLLLAIPTNLLIIQAALHGIRTRDDQLYLSREEADALAWIEAETKSDALILASPEMGLFIPAHTGRRVIYGHPYETVRAEEQKKAVEQYFRGERTLDELSNPVDFILFGPREREYGGNPALEDLNLAFRNDQVVIYRTP